MSTTSENLDEDWQELVGFTPEELLENHHQATILAGFKTSFGSTDFACDSCKTTEGVKLEPSRTAYHWDGRGEDPNTPIPLCRDCAEEHHEYWNERWEEFYSSRF